MPSWILALFAVLIVASVIMMVMQRRGGGVGGGGLGGGPSGAGFAPGILTVTGVSGRGAADKNGNAYFTVSGTITGDQTAPTEVYGTLMLAAGEREPVIGDDIPVSYKPGKTATSWRFCAAH